ncbi:MAG TPA: 3D domain-containing protein [Pyrinomonadaceae bacterium]|jgi:3D (Asp-Asp-Asp) domain-containing protein
MKSLFGGSAGLGLALLTASLLFYSSPLAAETSNPSAKPQPTPVQVNQEEALNSASDPLAAHVIITTASVDASAAKKDESAAAADVSKPVVPVTPPISYVATAYSLRGRGASGLGVRQGTIAADPRVLPFGTRVRLDAGPYSGEYIVTDSGTAVKGNKIDVWVPSYSEACRFGRRNIKLTVLSYGARRKSSKK